MVTGTLRITGHCVHLERSNGELYLLVWARDRTIWDASENRIIHLNPTGQVVQVHDGLSVVVGGGGTTTAGPEAEDNEPAWVSPPDASCSATTRWRVGSISGT
jgi:hypothetical protein